MLAIKNATLFNVIVNAHIKQFSLNLNTFYLVFLRFHCLQPGAHFYPFASLPVIIYRKKFNSPKYRKRPPTLRGIINIINV